MVAKVLPFHEFCTRVLRLELTPGQMVVAKVAFGDLDPADLVGEERELALELFGGVERVPARSRRFVVLRLGRGSGKTTMCAAYAVYVAVTQDVRVGPGDSPYVITVAPDRPTAALAISMAREMIRSNPALERLVVGDEKTVITIRRPTGLQVKIEAFAASRGGSSVRGRTILAFLLDEAEFFTSNIDGSSFAVSDTEIFRAIKPRLVRQGKGMLVSTPWPVETLMGGMFQKNWGNCNDATAVKAPTLLVRGNDPDIVANVEDERTRDPDNARREYDCELDTVASDGWFDAASLHAAVTEDFVLPGKYNPLWPTCAAADLGFKHDSSTLCIVQYDGRRYILVHMQEMKPKPGVPLKPSEVIKKFSAAAKAYGCKYIVSDNHYREAVKEFLDAEGMGLVDCPTGMTGKVETFSRTRSVLREGLVVLPKHDLTSRLISQAKTFVGMPTAGGGLVLKAPRKAGMGHGDLVSAWVIAIHNLAYGQVRVEKPEFVPNTPQWRAELERRLMVHYQSMNDRALRDAEREMKARMRGRRSSSGVIFPR